MWRFRIVYTNSTLTLAHAVCFVVSRSRLVFDVNINFTEMAPRLCSACAVWISSVSKSRGSLPAFFTLFRAEHRAADFNAQEHRSQRGPAARTCWKLPQTLSFWSVLKRFGAFWRVGFTLCRQMCPNTAIQQCMPWLQYHKERAKVSTSKQYEAVKCIRNFGKSCKDWVVGSGLKRWELQLLASFVTSKRARTPLVCFVSYGMHPGPIHPAHCSIMVHDASYDPANIQFQKKYDPESIQFQNTCLANIQFFMGLCDNIDTTIRYSHTWPVAASKAFAMTYWHAT